MQRLLINVFSVFLLFWLVPLTGVAQENITWNSTATGLRGRNNQQFTFTCPGNGMPSGSTWGTDLYTDDSSICTAAMHAGHIDQQAGGTITIEIRPGASAYAGSSRNGITTRSYGSWVGSFVVVRASGPPQEPAAEPINWGQTAVGLRGRNGQRFRYRCPGAASPSGGLWGTDLYTDDSGLCVAAVHAGVMDQRSGGSFRIEIRPGAGSYRGSTRNGVTSAAYGSWTGSYVFVGAAGPSPTPTPAPTPVPGAGTISWNKHVTDLRGQNNRTFRFTCPANGSLAASIWGTDTYTDDSAVCVAAVHRGLITAVSGGTVTIEIRPGLGNYLGTTRYGVTSREYGSWSGSYVFR